MSTSLNDVYRAYGRAMQQAQRFEKALVAGRGLVDLADDIKRQSLVPVPGSDFNVPLRDRITRLEGPEKTLGKLIGRCFLEDSYTPEFKAELKKVIAVRNALAHDFFNEHDLSSVKDRNLAVEELDDLARSFQKLAEVTFSALKAALGTVGVDDLHVQRFDKERRP